MSSGKACITHKVAINSDEDLLRHMGQECIIVDNGVKDLGGVAPVRQNEPITTSGFDDQAPYDMGTILPYETKAEKEKRLKAHGIPITKRPENQANK
jgi:hypothetical protein